MSTPRPKPNRTKKIADLIQREVAWFNGWHASDKSERESCEKAARKILRYLRGMK